jgi:hypothetical protein
MKPAISVDYWIFIFSSQVGTCGTPCSSTLDEAA